MDAAPATRWPAVWAVFAGGLVAGAYIGKVPPALPVLRTELGLDLVESAFVAAMFNVVGGLAGMAAGVLCDRFGQKRLGLLGLAVMAAGGFVGAMARDFMTLLSARFFEGAGFILFTVSAAALMSAAAQTQRDRARALSLWSAYMPTGGSLALLLAPYAIGAWGWRGLWVALALAASAAFVLVLRYAPAPRHGSVRSAGLVLESLQQKGNLLLALLFALYVAQWTSVMIWLPTYLIEEQGASEALAAAATALMVLANVPGNLGGGWILARGVRRGPLVVGASAAMAVCALGMLAGALPGALRYALVLAFSLSAGAIPASIFSGVPVHAKTAQHIATTNGMVMQSSQAGQFFGALALAWLAAHFGGWSASRWAILAFAAGAAACGRSLGELEKQRAAAA